MAIMPQVDLQHMWLQKVSIVIMPQVDLQHMWLQK
jgi:hypothetical protein